MMAKDPVPPLIFITLAFPFPTFGFCFSVEPKSLYLFPVVSHFYGTEYEIWAGFELVGSNENFWLGREVCYFWGQFFLYFHWKKWKHFKNIVSSALKSCNILGEKTIFAWKFKYKFWIGKKNQFCLAQLFRDTSPRDTLWVDLLLYCLQDNRSTHNGATYV